MYEQQLLNVDLLAFAIAFISERIAYFFKPEQILVNSTSRRSIPNKIFLFFLFF